MKRILKTILAFVLVVVCLPPSAKAAVYTPWADKSKVRVALNWDGNSTYSDQKITMTGAFEIYMGDDSGVSTLKYTNAGTGAHTIIAMKNALGFYITVDGQDIGLSAISASSSLQARLLLIHPTNPATLISYTPPNQATYKYRGDIFFRRYSSGDGRIYTVNVLSLQDYVRGVVGGEIAASAPLEAVKAQAICAASYAMHHMRHEAASYANVCNTTNCQVYYGTRDDGKGNINAAMNDIGGKLMYYTGTNASYKGKIVEALFFANTGSTRTIDNIDYGGTVDIPYLNSVDSSCETSADLSAYSGHANWSFTMDQTFAKSKFGIGEITNITPTIKDGSVNKIVLTGTSGSLTYTKGQCRSFMNTSTSTKLYSPHYTVSKVQATASASVITKNSAISKLGSNVYVQTKDGVSSNSKSINDIYIIDKNNKVAKAPATCYNFVFTGKGYGHFVGMSQVGAISMAKAGKTYLDILKHYYGSAIEVK